MRASCRAASSHHLLLLPRHPPPFFLPLRLLFCPATGLVRTKRHVGCRVATWTEAPSHPRLTVRCTILGQRLESRVRPLRVYLAVEAVTSRITGKGRGHQCPPALDCGMPQ